MTHFSLRRTLLATLIFLLAPVFAKAAPGWPANYEGVMLQGFYWDSWDDTKWTNLESQADELSGNFTLIWVPNSAKAASNPSNGYDPVYWFTNHNTRFGTEAEIRQMIKTFKAKGVGIIEDVVINHRSGKSNWTDFPAETWNGKTWKIGPEGICSTDEVKDAAGQAKPTGAPDTGEDFNGSRDLDHTNANVQENCKAYTKFLLEDMGYAGFRYDMVKGYAGKYTGMYNEYSNPQFSVGEYWDGSYDAVAAWIEATGKRSAAFDFPFKYAVNKAFSAGDMSQLVWKANGTTDQPAGMIHFGYPQYAVTFIDNHDTYRDDWNKFSGNVLAANAFMLSCPGTPCVFLPHWKANKTAIGAMIAARNLAGVHNMSAVKVLKATRDCYMAEVTGKRGTLAVKIGPSMDSPAGYSASDIKASGTDYCIWVKTNGQGGGDTPVTGQPFTVYYDNTLTNWATPHIHYWGTSESKWPGVAMTRAEGNVWSYTVPAGTTGCLFNAGDGDATKTADMTAVADHIYTKNGDNGVYQGGRPVGTDHIYIIGQPAGGWKANVGERISGENGVFVYEGTLASTEEYVYFGFAASLGADADDWTTLNGARYGSALNSELPAPDAQGNTVADYYTVAAPGSYPVGFPNATSWRIVPGTYRMTIDTAAKTLRIENGTSGIEAVDTDSAPAVYYNLQGVRVEQPSRGLYIRVRGQKAEKIHIR